jgi:hypothetical protein
MLAALGFGSIGVFTLLVMTKRISAVAGLILIPTVFGLLGGFGADLGNMMVSGVVDTAPTAVLLAFALLYFLVMTECGLFEPLIRKILSIVGEDPVRIVVGTAILIMCIGLDGDDSTAAFVVITSMYPIYRQVGINPLIIAMLLAIICPTLNWMPWGGPAARMAVSLEIDVADVVLPMLPALVLTLAAALVFAYFVGRGERRKLGARKAQAALVEEDGEASIGELPARDRRGPAHSPGDLAGRRHRRAARVPRRGDQGRGRAQARRHRHARRAGGVVEGADGRLQVPPRLRDRRRPPHDRHRQDPQARTLVAERPSTQASSPSRSATRHMIRAAPPPDAGPNWMP